MTLTLEEINKERAETNHFHSNNLSIYEADAFKASMIEKKIERCEGSEHSSIKFCPYTLYEAKRCFYHGPEAIEEFKGENGNITAIKSNLCGKYMAQTVLLGISAAV